MPLPYGEMSHADLATLRNQGGDQGMLAPFEHRAFAREWAQENPVLAGVSLPFAIPAYSAAKALGLHQARTPASLDELFAGYHGYAEGMLNKLVPPAQAHHEQSETVQRRDGKWINVYGRGTPKAGQPLPNSGVYDTVEDAVRAASTRSENSAPSMNRVDGSFPRGMLAPRKLIHSGGGVRG